MSDSFARLDLADTEPPTFTLDARDRHALGALRDYHQRINGDGVASAGYCNTVQGIVDLFAAWQAANDKQVMSADQPYRSATDHDPAAAAWERAQTQEAGEPDVDSEPAPVGHVHDQDHTVDANELLDQGVWNPQVGATTAQDAAGSASADYATPSPTPGPQDAQAAYQASLDQPAAGTSTSTTGEPGHVDQGDQPG